MREIGSLLEKIKEPKFILGQMVWPLEVNPILHPQTYCFIEGIGSRPCGAIVYAVVFRKYSGINVFTETLEAYDESELVFDVRSVGNRSTH